VTPTCVTGVNYRLRKKKLASMKTKGIKWEWTAEKDKKPGLLVGP